MPAHKTPSGILPSTVGKRTGRVDTSVLRPVASSIPVAIAIPGIGIRTVARMGPVARLAVGRRALSSARVRRLRDVAGPATAEQSEPHEDDRSKQQSDSSAGPLGRGTV